MLMQIGDSRGFSMSKKKWYFPFEISVAERHFIKPDAEFWTGLKITLPSRLGVRGFTATYEPRFLTKVIKTTYYMVVLGRLLQQNATK